MEIKINIEREHVYMILFVLVLGFASLLVFSQSSPIQGHPAEEILSGTFAGGGDYIFPSGSNVGIGTENPNAKLDVSGAVKLGSQDICNTNTEGVIRYNSIDKTIEFCDGMMWKKGIEEGVGGLKVYKGDGTTVLGDLVQTTTNPNFCAGLAWYKKPDNTIGKLTTDDCVDTYPKLSRLYYSTTDCTGTPYLPLGVGTRTKFLDKFYIATSGGGYTRACGCYGGGMCSYLDDNGICHDLSGYNPCSPYTQCYCSPYVGMHVVAIVNEPLCGPDSNCLIK